ncbi:hypothetical protein WELLINGTON_219 [Erwinia phage Wellington]|uniref:Uncharacterized protein n=1 Tax=Erwinia phage Wellington TaxID=2267653 RepID=A0A345BLM4_9CAUD|nr:hypothetical protein HOT70_gp082 [Erwinia phage Wellington]AXF51345.1 hypothetical protein WELLINGTON_219 [Erwinia phage Wellington]
MKIISIKSMPDNSGIVEMFNDDGTLFGFAFEPSKAHRDAMKAWTVPTPIPSGNLQWGQWTTYNSPLTAKMAQVTLAGLQHG